MPTRGAAAPAAWRRSWCRSALAAASPDLTILPVFLAAAAAGVFAAIGALIVFAAVTITTMIGLTLFACFGGYQVHGHWLDQWGNLFTAFVLALIGALVLTSVI
jgi:nickel/cobalt exporter